MIQQWLREFEPEPFLRVLKESGAHFIEMYLSLRQWEIREEWLNRALEKGLLFTFHGPYHGPYELPSFQATGANPTREMFLETFDRASRIAADAHFTSRVNLHGAMSRNESKKELFSKTLEFLKWLIEAKERRGWPLEFVLELLPASPDKVRVGDDIQDLVRIIEEVGDGLEGFCWDFGHFRRNELKGHLDLLSEDFLSRVRHVHIHDIRSSDPEFDHCPLIFGEVPWENYLGLLKGQDLFLVLEQDYSHTLTCGNPREELMGSLGKLKAVRDALMQSAEG